MRFPIPPGLLGGKDLNEQKVFPDIADLPK
jgi:hypothetical protein